MCARIRESVAAFSGSQSVTDDLTCLSVKIGTLKNQSPPCAGRWNFSVTWNFCRRCVPGSMAYALCIGPEDSDLADSLELAMTEAVSNIIRHAYEGLTDKKIIVEAQVYTDRVTVDITHWGKRFRPEAPVPKIPEATSEHGYGFFIISQIMDKVTYFDGPYGADCILLEKLLHKAAGGGNRMLAIIEKSGDVTIVKMNLDALDSGNEKRFKKEVISTLEPNSKVVLDLSEVSFIDSSGLGAMLSCYRHVQCHQWRPETMRLNEQVRTLFELVRMHRIFDIYGTREEAIDSYLQ